MKRWLKVFVCTFLYILSVVQTKAQGNDKDLLVQGINYATLHSSTRQLLDSILPLYHKATHDSTRLRLLNQIVEGCNEENIWPKYNEFMLRMAQNGDGSKPYLIYQAAALNNMGYEADNKGNIIKAIEYYEKALKIREQAGDKKGIAESINNLGSLYSYQNDMKAAIVYYDKARRLYEEIGDFKSSTQSLNNLGNAYNNEGDHKKAIEYNMKALAIQEKYRDEAGMANSLDNLGTAYEETGDTVRAIDYYKHALEIQERLGNTGGMVGVYNNLADIYYATDKKISKEYADKAFALAQELGFPKNIENVSHRLYKLYQNTGNYAKALEMYELYVKMRDSTNGIELVREATSSKYNQQEQQLKLEHEKRQAIAAGEIKKQRLLLLLIFTITIGVGGIAVLVYRNLQRYKKAKRIIEQQKELVEEKQKEILDSIRYAKRIQNAVLKEQEHVSGHLPEHFVLFQPKDIVSGDFYWSLEKDAYWYLAAADCTGHGVPGAFLTILGTSFLNELNATDTILTPAEILDKLRGRMIKELSVTGNGVNDTKDGMDISLARLNLKTNELMWAGANNPLWIYVNEKASFTEVGSHKQPIGFYPTLTPYPNHTIQLKKGDVYYLFTDGYADQFGGPRGKKFKYKKLQELLLSVKDDSLDKQKKVLLDSFFQWKGDYEQTDDVCIVAVRV